jgi:photosystem II stability/assembly factor-like uncharacterized protein
MNQPRNRLHGWLFALVASAASLSAAETRHDLGLSINLSGQGQVMGSKTPVKSGFYRSVDRQAFTHVGFGHIRFFTVVPDPFDPQGLYMTMLDGVGHSKDGGRTWRLLTDWRSTEAKGIAIDPNAPEHIYVGLPDGVLVSRNRGETWTRMVEGLPPVRRYTHAMAVDRTTAGRVVAGTETGIYLSEDGAKTWRLVQPTEKVTYDIRQSPHDPRLFLAANSGGGLFISRDGARTWQRADGVPVGRTLHNCDFDAQVPGRMLVCGWNAGLLVSEDGGKTWTDRTAGLPNAQVWAARFDPDAAGHIIAAPYLKPLYASDDGGRAWRPIAFEKANVFDIFFLPRR